MIIFDGLLRLGAVDSFVGVIISIFQTIVFVRRLHDVGKSGWWVLISLTIVGLIPLFVWSIRRGEPRRNRFDLDVRDAPSALPDVAFSIDRIERLHQLRRSGAINYDEYQALKKTAL